MAVRRVEKLITVSLEARKSVLVETVLSTGKYLRHVERARQLGYHVSMIFVALPTPALHVRRVKSRHASGGHDVPQEKIRSRWYRSHDFLALFALIVDHLFVFSNADPSGKPILVARKRQFTESVEIVSPEALPRVTEVLSAAASADEDGG
jgi:predicted ABC-type ATPase